MRWVLGVCILLTACGRRAPEPSPAPPVTLPVPPTPTTQVTDSADLLTVETRAELDKRLTGYLAETGHDLNVFISQTSAGEDHRQFGVRLWHGWHGVSDPNYKDGLVMFVWPGDAPHTCFIMTGPALEFVVTDAEASRICREVVRPGVLGGHPDEAIRQAVDEIIQDIEAASPPVPRHKPQPAPSRPGQ